MGTQYHDTIILYSAQTDVVLRSLLRDGIVHSQEEYVRKKYGESAPVFLTAYRWFVQNAVRYVPRPEGAEFPYWAFGDQYLMETGGAHVLTLEVPREEAVLFDMYDWNKVVQLLPIGENAAQERAWRQELTARGISSRDVMLTGFYPDLKQQTLDSWRNLFLYQVAGTVGSIDRVQAGLWRIKKEWLIRLDGADFKE